MSVRVVASVWAVAAAILALTVSGPSTPFPDPRWWVAGWGVAACAHLAVAWGAERTSLLAALAIAPVAMRAVALAVTLTSMPELGGVSLWVPVAYLLSWAVAIVWVYAHAPAVRKLEEVAP